jgi:undecaprenyl diphosphate synthase
MDGNGRWAQQRHLPRVMGHQKGVESVRSVVEECRHLKIPYLTLYAFSSENWGRPADEVSALMGLLSRYLLKELNTLVAENICLNVIGEVDRLPTKIGEILSDIVFKTKDNSGMTLTLALSYGSRDEILRTCRTLARDVLDGNLSPEMITEESFSSRLNTAGMPDPDFLIRTSGEMRISNFLLWQMAYTELYFCHSYWPDFDKASLKKALDEFSQRKRRFGLTTEQLKQDVSAQHGGSAD